MARKKRPIAQRGGDRGAERDQPAGRGSGFGKHSLGGIISGLIGRKPSDEARNKDKDTDRTGPPPRIEGKVDSSRKLQRKKKRKKPKNREKSKYQELYSGPLISELHPQPKPPPKTFRPAAPKPPPPLPVVEPKAFTFNTCRPKAPVAPGTRKKIPAGRIGSPNGSPREIIIGIDVGTSCTKIVVRDADLGDAFAVPIGRLAGKSPEYLLPSEICMSKGGVFSLENSGYFFQDFKTGLIRQGDTAGFLAEGYPEASPLEVMTAYLGIVIAHSRSWAADILGPRFRRHSVLWHANIGMPTNALHGQTSEAAFRIALLAGWTLSESQVEPTLGEVRDALDGAHSGVSQGRWRHDQGANDSIGPERVGALAEIIAEVVGYAQSKLRREGLHFIVDVGAGTLDLATFRIHQQDAIDKYCVFANQVYALGAARLLRHRVRSINHLAERKVPGFSPMPLDGISIADGFERLPDLKKLMPTIAKDHERQIDQIFSKCVRQGGEDILRITKTRRDPNAMEWQNGLPLFICGGGSKEPIYSAAMKELEDSKQLLSNGFMRLELKVPNGFSAAGFPASQFHRLAVANGLAYRLLDIGDPISPDDIDDLVPDPEIYGYGGQLR